MNLERYATEQPKDLLQSIEISDGVYPEDSLLGSPLNNELAPLSPNIDLSKINEERKSREEFTSDSEVDEELFTTIKETSKEDDTDSNVTFDQI